MKKQVDYIIIKGVPSWREQDEDYSRQKDKFKNQAKYFEESKIYMTQMKKFNETIVSFMNEGFFCQGGPYVDQYDYRFQAMVKYED
tara:strand:- start:44 stop:301 length:258 start_codon:yes stop_codon:yes gene_type:complete